MSSAEEERRAFNTFKAEVVQALEESGITIGTLLLENARSAKTYTKLRRDIFAVMNNLGFRTFENGVADFVVMLNSLQARAGKLGDELQARSLGADPADV